MGGAEQHGLLFQRDTGFTVLQHSFSDVACLIGLITHSEKLRAMGRPAIGAQVFPMPFHREIDDGVRGRQDGLGGSVVAVQRDDAGRGRELLREIYGWFTEGFDTPDLKEAKAMLDELI